MFQLKWVGRPSPHPGRHNSAHNHYNEERKSMLHVLEPSTAQTKGPTNAGALATRCVQLSIPRDFHQEVACREYFCARMTKECQWMLFAPSYSRPPIALHKRSRFLGVEDARGQNDDAVEALPAASLPGV
ncbi:hypothetical protein HPB50_015954 [Hyalomma asiaticum]|uniref:Uncharacterized protein n=1 Tax=Hyalomma asiaticum TaxID=266040 RepID=A0ACB7TIY5_HYAAI|nr:hypothetical protein HPB50_015954 [Hyalomma asiaticum]